MKLLKRYIFKFEASFPLYPIAFLFIIGLILYFRSVFNGFLGDDYYNIVENNLIHSIYNFPALFTSDPLFNTWNSYRPLMYAFFSVIYSMFGLNSGFYHLFDLLLHLLNTILLFIFLKKILILQKFRFPQVLSFILSLIFLVHPVNVEAVAYISVTPDLMVFCFSLLGLFAADYYCRKKGSIIIAFLIHLLILACLLSKETGLMVVVMIPAFCFLIYKKINKTVISFGVTPFVIYVLMRLIWDRAALGIKLTFLPSLYDSNLLVRLKTIPYEMSSYVRLIFFPKDLFMFQQDVVSSIFDPKFYLSLSMMVAAIAIICWLFFKYKSRILTFFLVWMAFNFLQISNIIPLTTSVAERWMYITLIGVLGFFGIIITHVLKYKKIILFLSLALLIFIPLAMLRTYIRIGDWKDQYTLYSHDLAYKRNDPYALNNYAYQLFLRGDFINSLRNLEDAFKIDPTNLTTRLHLGLVLVKVGKTDEAKKLFYDMLQDKNNVTEYGYIAEYYVENIDTNPDPDFMINLLSRLINQSPNDIYLNKLMEIAWSHKQNWNQALFYANRVYQLDATAANLQEVNLVNSRLQQQQ